MRILFIAPRFHTNQYWAVRALQDAGHQVSYLTLYEGATESHDAVAPEVVKLSALGRSFVEHAERKGSDRMAAMQARAIPDIVWLWRKLKQIDPDLIVVRDPTRPFALIALILGRLLRKKLVIYTQGRLTLRPSWKERVRALMLRIFDAAWMTPVIGRDESESLAHPRVFYIPFVGPPVQTQPSRLTEGPVRVLMIGKYEARKNHLLLIEALAPFLKNGTAVLTMVGEVSTPQRQQQFERVQAAVRNERLQNQVRVLANVPFDDMPNVYREAELFVLPSRNEPASVSNLEAMAYGLPAICSTTNGTACYITPGVNGYIFESESVESLREALHQAIADRAQLRKLSEQAAARVRSEFSAEAYLERMERMIAMLERGGRRSG